MIIILLVGSVASLFAKQGDWTFGAGTQLMMQTKGLSDLYHPGFGFNFSINKFIISQGSVGFQYSGNYISGKEPKYLNSGFGDLTNKNWAMNHDFVLNFKYYLSSKDKGVSPLIGLESGLSLLYTTDRFEDVYGNQFLKNDRTHVLYCISPLVGLSLPIKDRITANLILKYTWTLFKEDEANHYVEPWSDFDSFQHFDVQLTFNFKL